MLPDEFRVISFNGGSVALPKGWSGKKGGDGQQFLASAPDGLLQATLSVYFFSEGATEDDDKLVFDRFLELRLQADRGAAREITISTPTFFRTEEGTMISTFEGKESTVRRFAAKLAMLGGTLVVVYLEAVGQGKETIDEFAQKIFGSISLNLRNSIAK